MRFGTRAHAKSTVVGLGGIDKPGHRLRRYRGSWTGSWEFGLGSQRVEDKRL